MSDNVPLEIQQEIIKKVSDVKSLVQFRSVSKQWKSFIDSSQFINGYGARHTSPRSFILSYRYDNTRKYICLVDDDNETLKVQPEFAPFVVPSIYLAATCVVCVCHGLLCLHGYYEDDTRMVLIWNPSIRKSFGIALPQSFQPACTLLMLGFGVCPVTKDPTVVMIISPDNKPCHVGHVFTLSSGVWNVIPSGKLPRPSIKQASSHVVIDRFIYWCAYEDIFTNDGESTTNHMVVSFDLITKEFKVVDLPASLTKELCSVHCSVSKLNESLVVYGDIKVEGARCCGVWVMEHDSSFKKLFSIRAPLYKILGFRNNGEPIFEIRMAYGQVITLNIYEPCSQQIKKLGISGEAATFFMGSYKESLLLLDHSDLHIYSNDN